VKNERLGRGKCGLALLDKKSEREGKKKGLCVCFPRTCLCTAKYREKWMCFSNGVFSLVNG
jgi:hypothetical protein